LFQNIFEKAGPNTPSFVMHDYLYAFEVETRLQADDDLLLALHETETIDAKRYLIFEGVRFGGGIVWDRHDPVVVTGLQAYYAGFMSIAKQRYPQLYE
jgi:hypothetical protein